MKCDTVHEMLDAFVDGDLERSQSADVERHLAMCPVCSRRLDDLRRIMDMTAELPDSVEPARDLWPDIAARLDRPSKVVQGRFAPTSRRWMAVAAAAALSIGALVVAYTMGRHHADPMVARASATPAAVPASLAAPSSASVEAQFREARSELLAALEQRRDFLSDETLQVVHDNLDVIDQAIYRISAALDSDPDNSMLRSQLTWAYQQQIQLLQRANRLPAET